jgi:low affinity Fe/Cu permease
MMSSLGQSAAAIAASVDQRSIALSVPSEPAPEQDARQPRWMGAPECDMARKRNGTKPGKTGLRNPNRSTGPGETHAASHQGHFAEFAHAVARLAGKPATFLSALALIIVWAVSGPVFGFSDTWQLVVNTATTIVTFLMVFLIQNTQNRDTMALQVKLADLIIALRGTHNNMATAEDMSDEDLEALHKEYRKRAEDAQNSLERRRARAA